MRVLEVASEGRNPRSGIGRIVDSLTTGLEGKGHEVTVVGARARLAEFKFSTVPLKLFRDFDLLHIHGPTPGFSELTLLRNRAKPIVYSHYAEIQWLNRKASAAYVALHRRLAKALTRGIVVPTEEYRTLFDGRAQVIPPPVRPMPPPCGEGRAEEFTVLFVGQFRPFKGIDVLLEAARHNPQVHWIVAGSGWAEASLRETARGLPNVEVVISPDDQALADLYSRAHVLAVPAINGTEGFSLTAVEASRFGCVPVASDLLGVRENVRNLGGVTFKPGAWWELAAIVEDLRKDPGRWQAISEECATRGKTYITKYSGDYYTSKHLELFHDAIGEGDR